MATSAALFLLPLCVGWLSTLASPQFAGKVLPPEQLEMLARAYAEGFSGGRAAHIDAAMTGFYVDNNIGIAFRCFATGILFGLGSIFFLLYNGLAIGATFGYVMHAGAGANILTFGCGHAPFELMAIMIAGGAGLRLGFSSGSPPKLADASRQLAQTRARPGRAGRWRRGHAGHRCSDRGLLVTVGRAGSVQVRLQRTRVQPDFRLFGLRGPPRGCSVNLGQTRIAVRERGTAEVLDLACRVPFAIDGGLYARLSALTILPLRGALRSRALARHRRPLGVGVRRAVLRVRARPLHVGGEPAHVLAQGHAA